MKNNEVKKSANYDIDKLDMDILRILMDNADTPFTEIAKTLVVSGGTIHVRIKKMKDMGLIRGSYLSINPQKIGYDVCAFLGIYLEKGSQYHDAVESLRKIKEIVEMHYCTGAYSIFAKIIGAPAQGPAPRQNRYPRRHPERSIDAVLRDGLREGVAPGSRTSS